MPTLRDFFVAESAHDVAELRAVAQRLDGGSGEAAELHRLTRALRGAAQIAKEDRVHRVALTLEGAARLLTTGALAWSEDVSSRVGRTVEDIEALANGQENPDDADARVRRTVERWRELGVQLPAAGAALRAELLSEASRQFRRFAVHEIAGIAAELDVGLDMLAADARSREPLKSILRRERALLGAARLEEIPVVAEALRATEDMARIIAKLNVPVREEWLAVFRAARDVLKGALEPLQKGDVPGPSAALSQLRVLRQELTDRYGEVPGATGSVTPPAPLAQPLPAHAPDETVPIQDLLYSKERALKRALELKPELEQMTAADAAVRESLEEVFDLIRLGIA